MNAWARHITGAQLVHDLLIAPVLFGVFTTLLALILKEVVPELYLLGSRLRPQTSNTSSVRWCSSMDFPTLVSSLMKMVSITHHDTTESSTRLSKVTGESTLMVSVGCHYLSAASPTKGTRETKTEL